nr:WPE palindromic element domain-containing protein [Wolbachia endosymbiont (group B) of Ischnura elegans]
MPRHWDPEKLIVNKRLYNMFNKITKKLDPVSSTGMTLFAVQFTF